MIKIKCVKCGYSNVYNSEKDAYMDGWYYRDGDGQGYPYNCRAVEICDRCQKKELTEVPVYGNVLATEEIN